MIEPAEPEGAPLHSFAVPARRPVVPRGAVIAVALGGAVGAPARYLVGQAWPTADGGFPWSTLAINVGGAFLLGALLVLVGERIRPTRYARPFLGTGVLGSFTTFSTFSVETDLLLRDGRPATAAAYVLATVGVGLAAAWVGATLVRAAPGLGRSA